MILCATGTSSWRNPYLTQRGDLEHVQTRTKQQVAELDGLLLELGRGGLVRGSGRHRLREVLKGALTKGCRGLRREKRRGTGEEEEGSEDLELTFVCRRKKGWKMREGPSYYKRSQQRERNAEVYQVGSGTNTNRWHLTAEERSRLRAINKPSQPVNYLLRSPKAEAPNHVCELGCLSACVIICRLKYSLLSHSIPVILTK